MNPISTWARKVIKNPDGLCHPTSDQDDEFDQLPITSQAMVKAYLAMYGDLRLAMQAMAKLG